jgi:plastocyanin
MRKLFIALTAVAALATASPAAADTVTIVIRDTGFQPANVTVDFGDVVTWVNEGRENHQVEANDGSFSSPVLRYKSEYSTRMVGPGTHTYFDPLKPSLKGSIAVKLPGPPASGVSLYASSNRVVSGRSVTLSGSVSAEFGPVAGQEIQIMGKRFGDSTFTIARTVRTDANGDWETTVRPTMLTTYFARWADNDANSQQARIAVRPRLSIAYNRFQKRFTARVFGIQPRAGRFVYLQRLTSAGRWVNVRKATVGLANRATFGARLPVGAFRYRVFMTVNQAGPGYLGGSSGTLLIGTR